MGWCASEGKRARVGEWAGGVRVRQQARHRASEHVRQRAESASEAQVSVQDW